MTPVRPFLGLLLVARWLLPRHGSCATSPTRKRGMSPRLRVGLVLFFLAAIITPAPSVWSQPKPPPKDGPKAVLALPLGIPAGASTRVILRGRKLDTASAVRCTDDKVAVKVLSKGKANVPNQMDAAQVGDTQVEVEVTVPADFTGDALLIVVTPAGESPPHRVLVDAKPGLRDKEPNNSFAQAQPVALGQTVEGVIDGAQDVDVFRFEGKAGQKVALEVVAAQLGSPLDSHLTLYDSRGQILAANDDFHGSPDSTIEATLPRDGVYYVGLIDVQDQGGALFVYRLRLRLR
jgi:hypothetical protein